MMKIRNFVFTSMVGGLVVMSGCGGPAGPVQSLGSDTLFTVVEQPDGSAKIPAMIQRGDDMDARDEQGMTPLHHAAEADNADAVKQLLKAGADQSIQDNQGRTAFDIAQQGNKSYALWAFDKYQ